MVETDSGSRENKDSGQFHSPNSLPQSSIIPSHHPIQSSHPENTLPQSVSFSLYCSLKLALRMTHEGKLGIRSMAVATMRAV